MSWPGLGLKQGWALVGLQLCHSSLAAVGDSCAAPALATMSYLTIRQMRGPRQTAGAHSHQRGSPYARASLQLRTAGVKGGGAHSEKGPHGRVRATGGQWPPGATFNPEEGRAEISLGSEGRPPLSQGGLAHRGRWTHRNSFQAGKIKNLFFTVIPTFKQQLSMLSLLCQALLCS